MREKSWNKKLTKWSQQLLSHRFRFSSKATVLKQEIRTLQIPKNYSQLLFFKFSLVDVLWVGRANFGPTMAPTRKSSRVQKWNNRIKLNTTVYVEKWRAAHKNGKKRKSRTKWPRHMVSGRRPSTSQTTNSYSHLLFSKFPNLDVLSVEKAQSGPTMARTQKSRRAGIYLSKSW